MATIQHLLCIADSYKAAAGVSDDTTVSHRVFRDSKKLAALRDGGADITVGRFNAAIVWFVDHWPEASHPPRLLLDIAVMIKDNAA